MARASAEGFTETILGRRRYLPELQAANPRVRDMGRRMALNAPIQGGAADILKLAMIKVDRELRDSGLDCVMVLTVHDELVFDVSDADAEPAGALVKTAMETAYPLTVPLRVDLGFLEDVFHAAGSSAERTKHAVGQKRAAWIRRGPAVALRIHE